MAQEITVGGGGAFKATAMLATQSYSLSAATSPLVLTPPTGKVIRLDTLNAVSVPDLEIKIGSSSLISGRLSANTNADGFFNVNSPAESTDTATSSRFKTGVKEPVVAHEKDQSISIETTNIAAVDIYYSVSYGDL